MDDFGNVFIADCGNNHRIIKIQTSPEIVILAGSSEGIAKFNAISDASNVADETIVITPSDSVLNAISSITDSSTITITDDDEEPTVSFEFSSASIDENSTDDIVLTATLNEITGIDVEIPFTV